MGARKKYDIEAVKQAMIAMAKKDGNKMPSATMWDARRGDTMPTNTWIRNNTGMDWGEIAEELGLLSRRKLRLKSAEPSRKPTMPASPARRGKVEFVNTAFFAETHVPSVGGR